uniref:Alpha 1,4-glycosyltransferase domain-containing protein n=1 Tax=Timema monikensis TaxID=170555 RepID=A0A7R9EGM8_9NEOP|nr:unnamed protein product [Timema monikensis]
MPTTHQFNIRKGGEAEGHVIKWAGSSALTLISEMSEYSPFFRRITAVLRSPLVPRASLNGLKNFAGAESSVDVAVGVVNFHDSAVGREMANACLEDLREHFRGDTWGNNGPGVITRVLQARCKVKKAADFRTSAASLSWGVCCQPVVLGRVDPGFVFRVEWGNSVSIRNPTFHERTSLQSVPPSIVLRVTPLLAPTLPTNQYPTMFSYNSITLLTERDITSSPVASMLTISLSGDTDVHGEFSSDQRM